MSWGLRRALAADVAERACHHFLRTGVLGVLFGMGPVVVRARGISFPPSPILESTSALVALLLS